MEELKLEISPEEKIQHSKYILQVLLPFLKQFNEQQRTEKEMDAQIKGPSFYFVTGFGNSCLIHIFMSKSFPIHLK